MCVLNASQSHARHRRTNHIFSRSVCRYRANQRRRKKSRTHILLSGNRTQRDRCNGSHRFCRPLWQPLSARKPQIIQYKFINKQNITHASVYMSYKMTGLALHVCIDGWLDAFASTSMQRQSRHLPIFSPFRAQSIFRLRNCVTYVNVYAITAKHPQNSSSTLRTMLYWCECGVAYFSIRSYRGRRRRRNRAEHRYAAFFCFFIYIDHTHSNAEHARKYAYTCAARSSSSSLAVCRRRCFASFVVVVIIGCAASNSSYTSQCI